MKKLEITKYPNRKCYYLGVYDDETNSHYSLARFNDAKSVDEFQSLLGEHIFKIFGVDKEVEEDD